MLNKSKPYLIWCVLLLIGHNLEGLAHGQVSIDPKLIVALAASKDVNLQETTQAFEKCPAEKLGTWIGYNQANRIELRLSIISPTLIKELSIEETELCGLSEKMISISPPMSVTAFDKKGNAKTIEVDRYKWEIGCDSTPEVYPGVSDKSFDFVFSSASGKAWERLDKAVSPEAIPPQIWTSLENHIDGVIRNLEADRKDHAPPWKITLGKKISKKLHAISGNPGLLAVSLVKQVIVEQEGKIYDKGTVGVCQIIETKTFSPLVDWPIAEMGHPFSENEEDSPFLGEYGDGDFKIVLLGDYWWRLFAVSLGFKQEILTKISFAQEDCD